MNQIVAHCWCSEPSERKKTARQTPSSPLNSPSIPFTDCPCCLLSTSCQPRCPVTSSHCTCSNYLLYSSAESIKMSSSSKRSRTPSREHQRYCKELVNNVHSFYRAEKAALERCSWEYQAVVEKGEHTSPKILAICNVYCIAYF